MTSSSSGSIEELQARLKGLIFNADHIAYQLRNDILPLETRRALIDAKNNIEQSIPLTQFEINRRMADAQASSLPQQVLPSPSLAGAPEPLLAPIPLPLSGASTPRSSSSSSSSSSDAPLLGRIWRGIVDPIADRFVPAVTTKLVEARDFAARNKLALGAGAGALGLGAAAYYGLRPGAPPPVLPPVLPPVAPIIEAPLPVGIIPRLGTVAKEAMSKVAGVGSDVFNKTTELVMNNPGKTIAVGGAVIGGAALANRAYQARYSRQEAEKLAQQYAVASSMMITPSAQQVISLSSKSGGSMSDSDEAILIDATERADMARMKVDHALARFRQTGKPEDEALLQQALEEQASDLSSVENVLETMSTEVEHGHHRRRAPAQKRKVAAKRGASPRHKSSSTRRKSASRSPKRAAKKKSTKAARGMPTLGKSRKSRRSL